MLTLNTKVLIEKAIKKGLNHEQIKTLLKSISSKKESIHYTAEEKKEAYTWWRSLSINEMRAYGKKYFPAFDLDWVSQVPRAYVEVWKKVKQIEDNSIPHGIVESKLKEASEIYNDIATIIKTFKHLEMLIRDPAKKERVKSLLADINSFYSEL